MECIRIAHARYTRDCEKCFCTTARQFDLAFGHWIGLLWKPSTVHKKKKKNAETLLQKISLDDLTTPIYALYPWLSISLGLENATHYCGLRQPLCQSTTGTFFSCSWWDVISSYLLSPLSCLQAMMTVFFISFFLPVVHFCYYFSSSSTSDSCGSHRKTRISFVDASRARVPRTQGITYT